jgi:hypothetical protein
MTWEAIAVQAVFVLCVVVCFVVKRVVDRELAECKEALAECAHIQDRVRERNELFAEALALAQYGAKDEAIALIRDYEAKYQNTAATPANPCQQVTDE